MEYHHKNEYVLPLGRTPTGDLYARIREGRTLYISNDHEKLGYTIIEDRPRLPGQRTIDEFIE